MHQNLYAINRVAERFVAIEKPNDMVLKNWLSDADGIFCSRGLLWPSANKMPTTDVASSQKQLVTCQIDISKSHR